MGTADYDITHYQPVLYRAESLDEVAWSSAGSSRRAPTSRSRSSAASTRSRSAALACLIAVLGAMGAMTTDAQAWVTFGPRWKKKTITYRVASPSLASIARRAAATWNLSGAGVRWKRTSGRANVTIAITPSLDVPGRALLSSDGRRIYAAKIQIAPTAGDLARSPAERRFVRTLAVVHEMGHVMGLDHDTRFCATMQPVYRIGSPRECNLPDETWRFRCRLLEPDDLTGARRLFGGRPRVRGPEFCPLAAEPAPVTDGVAAPRPGGGADISWRTPSGEDVVAIRVLRGSTCRPAPPTPRPRRSRSSARCAEAPSASRIPGRRARATPS